MKLIDKDALVAEINKRVHQLTDAAFDSMIGRNLIEIRDSLDTLEVKEVDLEKVFNDEYSKFSNDTDAMDYAFPIDLADFKDFAKHFFELGMNTSKGKQ